MNYIFYISIFIIILFLIEVYTSFYIKKDNIYKIKNTTNNFYSGIIIHLISSKITKIFFIYFPLITIGYYSKERVASNIEIINFLFCLIIIDLSLYIVHKLKHSIPILWSMHFVHHSDEKYTMSTTFRASIVESFGLQIIVFIIPILMGYSIQMIILVSYLTTFYQFISHSRYIKFPHFMSYILITPQLHTIHHDQEIKNQNSNFGIIFSLWDRLFGTYVDKIDSFTPGIKGYHQDNFIKIQTDPIFEYLKKYV